MSAEGTHEPASASEEGNDPASLVPRDDLDEALEGLPAGADPYLAYQQVAGIERHVPPYQRAGPTLTERRNNWLIGTTLQLAGLLVVFIGTMALFYPIREGAGIAALMTDCLLTYRTVEDRYAAPRMGAPQQWWVVVSLLAAHVIAWPVIMWLDAQSLI